MRPRRSCDIPTCSGVAVARGGSSRAQAGSDTVVATTIAANAVVAANIFHLDMTFLRDRSCEDRVRLDPATILSDIVVLGHASGYRMSAAARRRQRPDLIGGKVKEQRIRNQPWLFAPYPPSIHAGGIHRGRAKPVIGRAFARPVGCVPSMNDSLEVEVLCPA